MPLINKAELQSEGLLRRGTPIPRDDNRTTLSAEVDGRFILDPDISVEITFFTALDPNPTLFGDDRIINRITIAGDGFDFDVSALSIGSSFIGEFRGSLEPLINQVLSGSDEIDLNSITNYSLSGLGDGNDTLFGDADNNPNGRQISGEEVSNGFFLDGDFGFDTAVFVGGIDEYSITENPSFNPSISVVDRDGLFVTRLLDFENFIFAGQSFNRIELLQNAQRFEVEDRSDQIGSGGSSSGGANLATGGDDNLGGGNGNDVISGFQGNDRILGQAGDDFLKGGGGEDTLIGGQGDDTLNGNGGGDSVKGGGGADLIRGNGGADALRGNGGADQILGGGGADDARGGGGSDTIKGGGGADRLFGNGGADVLQGQGGDDTLVGGGGGDIFQFRASDRADVIQDFRQGQDMVEIISGARNFNQLTIEQDGRDVLISFGAAGQVRVVTDNASAFDEGDFIF